jgi:hypothetical protein
MEILDFLLGRRGGMPDNSGTVLVSENFGASFTRAPGPCGLYPFCANPPEGIVVELISD